MLDIKQEPSGKFVLRNGPRSVDLTFEQVSWIYPDFEDIEEFNIQKAKEFYFKF